MRLILQVLVLAVIHFVAVFLLTFAAGIGSKNIFVVGLAKVLGFPLSVMLGAPNSEVLGWGAVILQSVVWGLLLTLLIRYLTGQTGQVAPK